MRTQRTHNSNKYRSWILRAQEEKGARTEASHSQRFRNTKKLFDSKKLCMEMIVQRPGLSAYIMIHKIYSNLFQNAYCRLYKEAEGSAFGLASLVPAVSLLMSVGTEPAEPRRPPDR